MKCDEARAALSTGFDGEALSAEESHELDAHLASCASCGAFLEQLGRIRQQLRFEAVTAVPDLASRISAALPAARRRARPRLAAVAAAFLAGGIVGASLAGLDLAEPPAVSASEISRRVLSAQRRVDTLTADLRVVERGWHPKVPVRGYRGTLRYRAPESLAVHLDDRTAYPGTTWVPNDVDFVAADDTWWTRGPAACPREGLPACTPRQPRQRGVRNREPFADDAPAPLDLVVPVTSFAAGGAQAVIRGERTIAGREAIGVVVTVAQLQPVLTGITRAGNWREFHPSDQAEVWLDRAALVPLAITVFPASGPDRARWAAARGYRDGAGTSVLEIALERVRINGRLSEASFPPTPAGTRLRDAGFARGEPVGFSPSWLPPGMTPHRAGTVRTPAGPEVVIQSWTDGRSWITLRSTQQWAGSRLFGEVGDVVRAVRLERGVAYVGEGGRRVAVHSGELDLVVSGSVTTAQLQRFVEGLDVTGEAVPADWAEAGTGTLTDARSAVPDLLLPSKLRGFTAPAIRVENGVVTISYSGSGARGFSLVQVSGIRLAPPLDPNVSGVRVRGRAGRYSDARGELEWVEGGRVLALRSQTLSLGELLAVAKGLRATP